MSYDLKHNNKTAKYSFDGLYSQLDDKLVVFHKIL